MVEETESSSSPVGKPFWVVLGLYAAVLAVLVATAAVAGASVAGKATPFVLILAAYVGYFLRLDRPERYPRSERRQRMLQSLKDGLLLCLVLLPLYLSLQFLLHRLTGTVDFSLRLPEQPLNLIMVHLIAVAIPEELFFRGLLQAALRRKFVFRIPFGQGDVGGELILASVLFAAAHVALNGFSLMAVLVFFPSLLFGLLYARHESIAGPVVFHAACNLTLAFFPLHLG